jgi:hypothetical protein
MSNVDLVSMPDQGSRCICCSIAESDELDSYLVLDQRQGLDLQLRVSWFLEMKGIGIISELTRTFFPMNSSGLRG